MKSQQEIRRCIRSHVFTACDGGEGVSGSSGKYVPGFVKSQKLENEEILIAIAVSLSIESFDLVIGSLHAPVVDRMRPPIQDASAM